MRIVEDESRRPDECIALGECVVRGLPERLRQGTPVQVSFRYDVNGRISIAAGIPASAQEHTDEIQLLQQRLAEIKQS
ncbi:MAG: hypothetical protein KDA62_16370 [Planctomycetales bacterium]|nr:hypothetical protein [Planctomycetales bacterium]